ncbi:FAD-binding oxidoreductase [Leptolyngbya sp. FACHB-36]|nr:FAD-binding oxidoreductase [Leptolyngbya sp. FACHB-36]MBD2019459.1 FAD-binding oxidoreductase [Leptolyngbya sp. FACHB-36]
MAHYDWIVVGGGITGSALSYELVQQGFSVLLIEQHSTLQGGTRFGYGGLAYWSGTTELTRQLCAEGIERHRSLSQELDSDTQFRDGVLLLTIRSDSNPQTIARTYAQFAIPPRLVSVQDACELEPLIAPQAIAGALVVPHGRVNPEAVANAYARAFLRAGGTRHIAQVTELRRGDGLQITGVVCGSETFASANVAVCAGALSRSLLKAARIPVRLYFTHAELIETPPIDLRLQALVMPAETQRFEMEAAATAAEVDPLWDEPGHEPTAPILDAGVVQLVNGQLRIGQISRTLTDPTATIDAAESEAAMRRGITDVLPALETVPGTWHRCLVAFSHDRLPLIGAIPGVKGVHLFSGFSNPLVLVPPLASRFAAHAAGQRDEAIEQLSPGRWQMTHNAT